MTDEEQKTEEREPTTAEAAKIAAAGAEAIKNADDPAKAETAAADAIEAKAEELKVKISREDAVMIASATIEALEARGAFRDEPEAAAQPALDAPAEQPSAEQQGGQEQHDGEHHEHAHQDAAPRKRSWASRYLGKGGDE